MRHAIGIVGVVNLALFAAIAAICVRQWLRAREVWLGALDLRNGAVAADLPADVRRRAASALPSLP